MAPFLLEKERHHVKFLDEAKITMASGHGGTGCVSFRREKYVEFGGPDGGNGGKGGDVIIRSRNDLNTLIDFRYQQHFRADRGEHGKGKNKTGAHGDDIIIEVPVGTQILDEHKDAILADFDKEGMELKFLTGGDGGFGNANYKSSTNQAPRKSTPGWPGTEMEVWLRLKLIADIGLLGLPNAGKSTFLSIVSNAKPKVADYPFTTLHPNLGVVKAGDTSYVIADIPGLIEGASEGIGLGYRFLGHVERSAALLHIIDITSDDIVRDYHTIRTELEKYDSIVAHKDEIIVLNKIDSVDEDFANTQKSTLESAINKPIHLMSSVSNAGIKDVLFTLGKLVKESKSNQTAENKDA